MPTAKLWEVRSWSCGGPPRKCRHHRGTVTVHASSRAEALDRIHANHPTIDLSGCRSLGEAGMSAGTHKTARPLRALRIVPPL